MTKNSQIDNEEINLIELMYTVWMGKWKIAAAVVISFVAVIIYKSILPGINSFTAITEIRPISALDINKFSAFNNNIQNTSAFNNNIQNTNDEVNKYAYVVTDASAYTDAKTIAGKVSQITSLKLLNLYLDILEEKSVFEEGIRKFNLLEASQYNNAQEYNEAIIKLASSIKIMSPSTSVKTNQVGQKTFYHTINFTYDDVEKWKNVLTYVDDLTNKLSKKAIVGEFNNTLSFLKKEQKYRLEDIEVKINNLLIDYEREVSNHISYLKEQSEIAKKLGVAKNTIEVQTFGNQNALLSNVKTDSPFYLRGYEAIDKEIELIESRDDKKPFIKGLFDLEKKKRAIEQDQTIVRTELILESTLLVDNSFLNSKEFSAASASPITTIFEYKKNKKFRVLAIVIGLIVGVFYVLISSAFQSHRIRRKKTD